VRVHFDLDVSQKTNAHRQKLTSIRSTMDSKKGASSMSDLIQWFVTHYPHIAEELHACQHHDDRADPNPFHLEGDCWTHTMLTVQLAQIQNSSLPVQVAALLHDIGKPHARRINPHNRHVQFFGHEAISAKRARPIVSALVEHDRLPKAQAPVVLELIASHSLLYRTTDPHSLFETFKDRMPFLEELFRLTAHDHLGRFHLNDTGREWKEIDALMATVRSLSYTSNHDHNHHTKKLFLLFSHTLTSAQIADAQTHLGIETFVSLPDELQHLWSHIPPGLPDLSSYLKPLKAYIRNTAQPGDVFLIQGDFGGCFDMVNYVKHLGMVAVHSTTERHVTEKTAGGVVEKISRFEHVMFREY
jgi:hypothetical protein